MRALIIILLAIGFSMPSLAKKKTTVKFKVPDVKRQTYKGKYMKSVQKKIKAELKKMKKDGKLRKLANQKEFSINDVEQDVRELGQQWKEIKTVEQLENKINEVIDAANAKDSKKSNSYKLLAGHLEVAREFQSIIWRARPILDSNSLVGGNKMTHISAIQLVRGVSNGIHDWLPNPQMNLYKKYVHEPSTRFSSGKDQFKSVRDLQIYLAGTVVKTLNQVTDKLEALVQLEPYEEYVYHNRWAWGPNDYPEGTDIVEFSAIGFGEKNLMLSSLYEAKRDFLVFSAYNHDAMVRLAGELGKTAGIDAFGAGILFGSDDLGMSDIEKISTVRSVVESNRGYMSLNAANGRDAMKNAGDAMVSSIENLVLAYEHFNGPAGGADNRPEEIRKYSDRSIANLKRIARTEGPVTVREPLTGKRASVNVAAFYNTPPLNLSLFLANKFDYQENSKRKKMTEFSKPGADGKTVTWRNYDYGKSIGWDNNAWRKYVPSARDKKADYMLEAKRIITSSGGTSFAFGLPTAFVH